MLLRSFSATHQTKTSGGLGYVTIQTNNEQPPTTVLDKEDLDATLLEYSHKHFATAQGSPFTTEPLARLLQYDGLTPFGDRVFNGCNNFKQFKFDEPTQALLRNVKNKTTSEAVWQHPLNYNLLMQGIKKWPEKL